MYGIYIYIPIIENVNESFLIKSHPIQFLETMINQYYTQENIYFYNSR